MRTPNFLGRAMRLVVLTALIAVVAHGAATAGTCVRADVDRAIRLPDGSLHDAGTLRLCLDRDYSPVAVFHTASIDNRSLGLMTSRRVPSEGVIDEPFVMFVREADGSLKLYGYALRQGGHMNTYLLQSPPRLEVHPRVAVDTVSVAAATIPAGAE